MCLHLKLLHIDLCCICMGVYVFYIHSLLCMLCVVSRYMLRDYCITLSSPTLGYNCIWLSVCAFIFGTFILWGFVENLIVS